MYRAMNISLIFAIISILVSCQSARNEKKSDESSVAQQTAAKPFAVPSSIAPNHCRILATVVAIDTVLKAANPNDPCAKAPCNATVRVDSLLGYGSGFPATLSRGQQISARFRFTTAPTAGLLPELSQNFPGVRVGTKILADVEGSQAPAFGETSGGAAFTISGYEVK